MKSFVAKCSITLHTIYCKDCKFSSHILILAKIHMFHNRNIKKSKVRNEYKGRDGPFVFNTLLSLFSYAPLTKIEVRFSQGV